MAEAETALDIHQAPPRQQAGPSTNLPIRQYSPTPDSQTPTNLFSAKVYSQQYARQSYGDDGGPRAGPGVVGLGESNPSSSCSSRGKLDTTVTTQESYQQEQQQQRSFLPVFHAAATFSTCDGRPLVNEYDSDMGGDGCTPSAHRATCNTARGPKRTEQFTGRGVARHGDSSGDGSERISKTAVEEAASAIAVEDIAIVHGPASVPSPIEHVLARRKRRRRVNFSVSSALWLSASAEDTLRPPAPVGLPFSSLPAEEEDKHDSAPGFSDNLESPELR